MLGLYTNDSLWYRGGGGHSISVSIRIPWVRAQNSRSLPYKHDLFVDANSRGWSPISVAPHGVEGLIPGSMLMQGLWFNINGLLLWYKWLGRIIPIASLDCSISGADCGIGG